ncbi:sarcosine oxidase, gamma subunit family, heterotetrameric form [Shewanella psychrophila]|uniref:Sarcosine oxidase, gamma subunit family, heterotetrameric form n=2 Tax=Shewanella psychrophila TaxID=225848 RepID=A0A1S6HK63_9GAMM|nr:sarcosine oxidase, gamma subunit family, heterotetrameric form [Shewanella psychrophila]
MSDVESVIKKPGSARVVISERPKVDAPISITSKVLEMQQLSIEGVQAVSPLSKEISQASQRQNIGVHLSELAFLGHLVLRGNSENKQFSAAIETVLGVPLPSALQSETKNDLSISWISPDEWLVILPITGAFEIERRLRIMVDGHCAVVNVSGGQTVLSLSGTNALQVLHKSTPYDVHERNFPVGKVVTTVFAKAQVIIRRTGPESWELTVRRSFADYVWQWLMDASTEYGVEVSA